MHKVSNVQHEEKFDHVSLLDFYKTSSQKIFLILKHALPRHTCHHFFEGIFERYV